jgi:ABC-type polysaccharide/polyol phosphate transport system ATPase subunit
MDELAIRFDHVSKRFRRGERFDSLRDLVPALARRVLRRPAQGSKAQRDFWALKDVCLEVRKGETLGVIGHNGAGKSTMLKHLAGIMVPTKGRIDVDGRLSALIEVGAGFHQDLTGRENVFLNGVILGMARAEVARKFDEIVEFAGLAEFIDTPVKRYSSGMYARLGFAVAAHLDPDILVIDEVLSVGDFMFQQKSLQKMRQIAGGGATVLFVSHNLKAVSDLCARTVLMDAGAIAADGATSEVIQTYLARERAKLGEARDREVAIRSVNLRGRDGPAVRFSPGDKAWIDITFHANRSCPKISVVLQVLDNGLGSVFHTSSERLGSPPIDLEAGQACTLTFELDMHLANGTFHVGVYLHRHAHQYEYDKVLPAATFFIGSEVDVRGSANLYPRVVAAKVT